MNFNTNEKKLPELNFKLISPGILRTRMNKKIKNLDIALYPDLNKFCKITPVYPQNILIRFIKNIVIILQ